MFHTKSINIQESSTQFQKRLLLSRQQIRYQHPGENGCAGRGGLCLEATPAKRDCLLDRIRSVEAPTASMCLPAACCRQIARLAARAARATRAASAAGSAAASSCSPTLAVDLKLHSRDLALPFAGRPLLHLLLVELELTRPTLLRGQVPARRRVLRNEIMRMLVTAKMKAMESVPAQPCANVERRLRLGPALS